MPSLNNATQIGPCEAIQAMREGFMVLNCRKGSLFKLDETGVKYFGKRGRTWKPAGTNNTIYNPAERFQIVVPESMTR
jgi:hypothetical protein